MQSLRVLPFLVLSVVLIALGGCAPADPICAPITCEEAGRNCGEIDDGCGGTIRCGDCPDGQTCGGSGTANVCGVPGCTPTTCEAQGKNCGEIDDGCGGKLTCGTCRAGETCGGGGISNVCGPDCDCPQGFACGEDGLCSGGDPEGLQLDVRTATITGRVLHNGVLPERTPACSNPLESALSVQLLDVDGRDFRFDISCANKDFTFEIPALVGTYRVRVATYPGKTDFPDHAIAYEFPDELVVNGDLTDLVLDVPSYLVKGKLTLEGETPQVLPGCGSAPSEAAVVKIRNDSKAPFSLTDVPIPCDTTDFSFETRLYAGTWSLSVVNGGSPLEGFGSNLPATTSEYRAFAPLELAGDVEQLELDVRELVDVSGFVRPNGAPPLVKPGCVHWALLLHFEDKEHGGVYTHQVRCDRPDFDFSAALFPGVYEVRVQNLGGATPLTDLPDPAHQYVAIDRLEVAEPISDLIVDAKSVRVSGRITLDGVAPEVTETCVDRADAARVTFQSPDNPALHVGIPCTTSDFSFDALLYPGSYDVSVANVEISRGWNSSLPKTRQVVASALPLLEDRSDFVLELKTPPMVKVNGTVTVDGATPSISPSCDAEYGAVHVGFAPSGSTVTTTVKIPCTETDLRFSAQVEPGSYDLYVRNVSHPFGFSTNLPRGEGWSRVKSGVEISEDIEQFALDVVPVRVAGSLVVDGNRLAKTAACLDDRIAYYLVFEHPDYPVRGPSSMITVGCERRTLDFEALLYPGEYKVTVTGVSHGVPPIGRTTTLPNIVHPMVLVRRLQLP